MIETAKSRETASIPWLYKLFYAVKPLTSRHLQLYLRRKMMQYKRIKSAHIWPIDESTANAPDNWRGWPDGKKFALVLMHDVDTQAGHDKCRTLMDLDEAMGFRSAFNFVPERYRLSKNLLGEAKSRGFEIGVHGLKHDGKLFFSRELFLQRAGKINQYLADWNTRGFSTPSMLRNLQWIKDLNIDYSTSTFDTDPFEPQPEGAGTIFPFWVGDPLNERGYLELPYTLAQDFTLFILMRENSINIWRQKLDWIAEKGGLALINTHPDYMCFDRKGKRFEEYNVELYVNFLKYVRKRYNGICWETTPKQLYQFWATMRPNGTIGAMLEFSKA
jgi:hypothetical protein